MSNEDIDHDLEANRELTERCNALVQDFIHAKLMPIQFINKLHETGISPDQAKVFIQDAADAIQRSRQEPEGAARYEEPDVNRERTPDGLSEQGVAEFRKKRSDSARKAQESAVKEIEWAQLKSKFLDLDVFSRSKSDPRSDLLTKLIENVQVGSASSAIPASVLDELPHLKALNAEVDLDEHLHETWRIRKVFANDPKAVEATIDLLQVQKLRDPLPRALWKVVVLDQYLDFQRLHASFDKQYDRNEAAHDFFPGFSIVKKDGMPTRKAFTSEGEWIRLFSAYKAAVVLIFPHRQIELDNYEKVVVSIIRASPSSGISFDQEARNRYAKAPYHLDDMSEHNINMLSLLTTSVSSSQGKRASASLYVSSKRLAVPCENWNMGICSDPCKNRRQHGFCSECGDSHRARDKPECLILLQAKRAGRRSDSQSGVGRSTKEGSSGAGRA